MGRSPDRAMDIEPSQLKIWWSFLVAEMKESSMNFMFTIQVLLLDYHGPVNMACFVFVLILTLQQRNLCSMFGWNCWFIHKNSSGFPATLFNDTEMTFQLRFVCGETNMAPEYVGIYRNMFWPLVTTAFYSFAALLRQYT